MKPYAVFFYGGELIIKLFHNDTLEQFKHKLELQRIHGWTVTEHDGQSIKDTARLVMFLEENMPEDFERVLVSNIEPSIAEALWTFPNIHTRLKIHQISQKP